MFEAIVSSAVRFSIDEKRRTSSPRHLSFVYFSSLIVFNGETGAGDHSIGILEEQGMGKSGFLIDREECVELQSFPGFCVLLFEVVFHFSSFAFFVFRPNFLLLLLIGHRNNSQDQIHQIEGTEKDHRHEVQKMITSRCSQDLWRT